MRASHLRLSGFKSFVEPAELPIEDGLTGIVGPNGCGKSNLLDALCWVMGEGSFRNMRAKNMEDIIFSGTALRPPHNHAEATLAIDNADHAARAPWRDADVIEVTRRIERESGAGYRINRQPVLTREARVLFADMIGGAHSPFLVRQGRIAQLISAAPKERRILLDQAAGIGGLRARRHEAELQLNAASANLERLNDALEELRARLEALKRQERQAKRYRSLAQRIRAIEALLLYARWREAREEESALADSLAEAQTVLETAARAGARASTRLQETEESRAQAQEAEASRAAALQRLRTERETLDERERQLQARQENLETLLAQTEKDLEHETARERDFQETRERLAAERATLQSAAAPAAAQAEQVRERAQTARRHVASLEGALEKILAEAAQEKSRREESEREAARQQARVAALDERKASINQERERLRQESAEEAPSQSDAHARQLESLRESQEQAEQACEAARQAESRAREALEEKQRERHRLEVEISALQDMLGEGRNGGGSESDFPGVIHALTVEPSYEIAMGAVLGTDLDASLDAGAPVCWKPLPPLPDAAPLPEGAQPIQTHIRAPDALARRLSHIGVVAREQGEALQPRLAPGQILVSIEGDVWRWDGYHASAAATAGVVAEKLTRRNHLRDLETRIAEVDAALPPLQDAFAAAQAASRAAQETEQSARQARRESEARFFAEQEHALRAREESQERAARLQALGETFARLEEEQEEARRASGEAEAALASAGDGADLEQQASETRSQLQAARDTLAREQASEQALERDIAARERRLGEIAAELASWEERNAAIGAQMEALRRRREESLAERESLSHEPAKIVAHREKLLQLLADAEAAHRDARDALAVAEQQRKDAGEQDATAREDAAAAREERARREGLLEGARQRLGEAETRIRSELECAPEDIPEQVAQSGGAPKSGEEESAETLEERLRRLVSERERLGGVNLRAEEDAEETRARLTTIETEQEDLQGAIARLRQAIARLNKEGRERLSAAFERVNQHFGELFVRLFGGGAAHLRLLEGEGDEAKEGRDVLEAGLEIMARPPGKRLQSLSLLSGGEQTLTALALIFGVFLANAPPICVLDEADAPLDDINVERFCRLVRDVCDASGARILLITHHPLTMARMDRLFGVTMQERGVSRLVSVNLREDGGVSERETGDALALEAG